MTNFTDMGLGASMLERLTQIGYTAPTPIQAEAIPHALLGKDILGSAGTGTGKTAAFGIPMITHLLANGTNEALVLLPTRELALQVMKSLEQLIGSEKISIALLIGGEDMGRQFRQLRASPRLIVGTPGRINDHLTRGSLKLNKTNFLVLDEVDRMLDLGFGVQLEKIAKYLIGKRQTLMFSATMPQNIVGLAGKYLTDPMRISVNTTNKCTDKIKQEHVKLSDAEKFPRLMSELDTRTGSIIVFIKTKYAAESMAKKLCKAGHKADALHGDLRQNKRNTVIAGFRKQDYRILVATDIASRGLDIPHIEHVINYDLPQVAEDYIHRIGRTARAGAEGAALSFLTSSDGMRWKSIQNLLNPGAKPMTVGGGGNGGGNRNDNGGGRRNDRRGPRTGARTGPRTGPRTAASGGKKPQSRSFG